MCKNYLLTPSSEARADFYKNQQRVKDEQESRVRVTVDEWMRNEGTVENALLEAVKEVSGDMALLIAESSKQTLNVKALILQSNAMDLLIAQIRKELKDQVREHLFS